MRYFDLVATSARGEEALRSIGLSKARDVKVRVDSEDPYRLRFTPKGKGALVLRPMRADLAKDAIRTLLAQETKKHEVEEDRDYQIRVF